MQLGFTVPFLKCTYGKCEDNSGETQTDKHVDTFRATDRYAETQTDR